MTTETGRPSGGGPPVEPDEMTLDQLITALIKLRGEPDDVEAIRRCPELGRAAPGVMARTRVARMEKALDKPRMTKAKLAKMLGIHVSGVYGKTAPKVTPS